MENQQNEFNEKAKKPHSNQNAIIKNIGNNQCWQGQKEKQILTQ
jgi:hypothetical protein